MTVKVSIGEKLFHKYLGLVTITYIGDNGIKADTGARGVLDFNYYDFGKVLYFDKSHSNNSYKTFEEYLIRSKKTVAYYCRIKKIDIDNLPIPNGALQRI